MPTWFYLASFCLAFISSVLTIPLIIYTAKRIGILDRPDGGRKQHLYATPKLGGLAIGFAIAMVALLKEFLVTSDLSAVLWSYTALFCILLVGLWDDLKNISPATKMLGQALVAAMLYCAGQKIEVISIANVVIDLGLLGFPITIIWYLGCMNIWNLIDGMDGLAAGMGIIVTLTMICIGQMLGNEALTWQGVALIGGLAGFLIYNYNPARIFLGDSGSLLLGTVLGTISLEHTKSAGPIFPIGLAMLAMGVPVLDTLLAIVRRWAKGISWNTADASHIHHQLLKFGLQTKQATAILYLITINLCTAAIMLCNLQTERHGLILGGLGVSACLVIFYGRRQDRQCLQQDIVTKAKLKLERKEFEKNIRQAMQEMQRINNQEELIQWLDRLSQLIQCKAIRLEYNRDDQKYLFQNREPGKQREYADPVLRNNNRGLTTIKITLFDWPAESLTIVLQMRLRTARNIEGMAAKLEQHALELMLKLRNLVAEEALQGQAFKVSVA